MLSLDNIDAETPPVWVVRSTPILQGLGILLELAKLNQAIEPSSQEELIPEVSEAVRCLANVLLLHDSARKRLVSFPNVTEAVLCMGLVRPACIIALSGGC